MDFQHRSSSSKLGQSPLQCSEEQLLALLLSRCVKGNCPPRNKFDGRSSSGGDASDLRSCCAPLRIPRRSTAMDMPAMRRPSDRLSSKRCCNAAVSWNLAPDTRTVLEDGFKWCARLLLKELRVATRRTQEGTDVEYSDGSKLDRLLEQPYTLDRVAQRAKCAIPADLHVAIHAQAKEGERVRRVQKRADTKKAFVLLLQARETWPWVAANNLVAIASGILYTVAMDYQALLLEAYQQPRHHSSGKGGTRTPHRFGRVAAAWVIVELCTTLLDVLGSQLSARGEKVASRILQVELFRAVARQEIGWWETKAEADVGAISQLVRHKMPHEVNKVLNIPRDFLCRITSIVTAAWRMQQRSSSLLYKMVGIHWFSLLARRGIKRLREFAQRRAYRGVVMPSQDDKTYRYALRPEFAMLYQSCVRGHRESKLFEQALLDYQRYEQRMVAAEQLLHPAEMFVSQGSNISQFWAVGGYVQQGLVTDGQAWTLMDHAAQITREMESTYHDWANAQAKCAELAKAHDLITIKPKIDPDAGSCPGTRCSGHLTFNDVHFEYPNRKGVVLKGVSFDLPPGKVAGIVGKTGCGKSTLFRLLQRFYEVTTGSILLDGKDIRTYNPEWLRRQMATVSQEPDLIPLTIRDNITIGSHGDPSVEEIEAACRAANIWDTLSDKDRFPEGLQTKMRAVKNISGGEKQRICIARAILANPPILLLDEATSALDKETEVNVQSALEKLMQGRTTLVIAHRLTTVRHCNTILGMKDGKVVENGSHDELLSKSEKEEENGIYARLWREQGGTQQVVVENGPQEEVLGKTNKEEDNDKGTLPEQSETQQTPPAESRVANVGSS